MSRAIQFGRQSGAGCDVFESGRYSAGEIGFEDRRVHEVGMKLADDGPDAPDAIAPSASCPQQMQSRAGFLDLGLHAGPVMKVGHVQFDASGHQP